MTFKYYNTTREVLTLFLTAFIEPILYHPMIVFFSLRGYFSYITSQELAWGTMTRRGFDSEDDQNEKYDNKKDGDGNSGSNSGGKKPSVFERLRNRKSPNNDLEPLKT
jgi:hypothetical protein